MATARSTLTKEAIHEGLRRAAQNPAAQATASVAVGACLYEVGDATYQGLQANRILQKQQQPMLPAGEPPNDNSSKPEVINEERVVNVSINSYHEIINEVPQSWWTWGRALGFVFSTPLGVYVEDPPRELQLINQLEKLATIRNYL